MKHRYYLALAAAGFIASIAFAAGIGSRLTSPVLVGQHLNAAQSITFDQNLSPNPSLTTDTSGDITIGAGGTGSLSWTGIQQLAPDGSPSIPAYAFTSESGMGLFRSGTHILGAAANGSDLATWSPTVATIPGQFQIPDGTVSSPAYSFGSSPNTGIYRTAGDAINFTSGGTQTAVITAAGLTVGGSGGGNTPHTCTARSNSNASPSATVTCSTHETLTGGGCESADTISVSKPQTLTPPAVWACTAPGASSITAWAICCLE